MSYIILADVFESICLQNSALTNNIAMPDDMTVPDKTNKEPKYCEITNDEENGSKMDLSYHRETYQNCQAHSSVSV